jgi:hypothetical protein
LCDISKHRTVAIAEKCLTHTFFGHVVAEYKPSLHVRSMKHAEK